MYFKYRSPVNKFAMSHSLAKTFLLIYKNLLALSFNDVLIILSVIMENFSQEVVKPLGSYKRGFTVAVVSGLAELNSTAFSLFLCCHQSTVCIYFSSVIQ